MRQIVCIVIVGILFSGGLAFSEETDAPSRLGELSLSVGYHGSYLHYTETSVSGNFLDRDTGWMNGIAAEATFESPRLFIRGFYDYVTSANATYEGSLQDGTPITMSTKERIYRYEGDIGYKVLDTWNMALIPYIGIGYRNWKRGEDRLPDYLETYTWYYAAVGVHYRWMIQPWTVGADAALQIPFDMKMKTTIAGLYDNATFTLKSRPGFKLEAPITYTITRPGAKTKVFVFTTPYYQYWKIGRSDEVVLTQNGIPAAIAYEPASETHQVGIKVGLGVSF